MVFSVPNSFETAPNEQSRDKPIKASVTAPRTRSDQPRSRCVLTCSINLSFLGSPLSPTRLHPCTGQGKSSRQVLWVWRWRFRSSFRVNEVRCPLLRQPGYKQIQGLLESDPVSKIQQTISGKIRLTLWTPLTSYATVVSCFRCRMTG